MNSTIQNQNQSKKYEWKIVWKNIAMLALLHGLGFYGALMKRRCLWATYFFGKVHAFLIAIGVTAGIHRYFCHRTYKATKLYEFGMIVFGSSIAMESVYVWCRDHRVHHRYSETDADPYNARRGFFFSHIGWLFVRKHPEVIKKGKLIDLSDLESNWMVMFQHKYYYVIVTIFGFAIPIFLPCILFNESLSVSFFLNMYKTLYLLHLIWFVNSVAHLYGTKPYDSRIGPTESPICIRLNLGEGFHNFHHTFPWDYRASEYKYDGRNGACVWIDAAAYLGFVSDRKEAPKELIDDYVRKHGGGNREEPNNDRGWKWWITWITQLGFLFIF